MKHTGRMRKAGRLVGLALALALISTMARGSLLPQVVPAFAADNIQVSISAADEVAPDTDFTATVDMSQVENFDACNYDVSFDSIVLRLDNVTSGDIGGTVIPVDMWSEISPGTVRIIQNVSGLSGVSGSGYLAVLHFHVIGSIGDSSNIELSNGVLSSNLAEEILATWIGDSVDVVSVEPSGEESPVLAPESGTADASNGAPAPPPPAAETKHVNWPVLWGVIGGVVVVGLLVFFLVRRKA